MKKKMVFIFFISLFVGVFFSCQHNRSTSNLLKSKSQYGQLKKEESHANVVLIPQWHLSAQQNTHDQKISTPPQSVNQLAIYEQVKDWVQSDQVQNLIIEGCEGEIKDGFKEKFNGWSLLELEKLSDKELDSVLTHVGLKLKARFKSNLKVICGDSLDLIKQHQLAFSDVRGLFGFKSRLLQYKNDPEKQKSYLQTLRPLVGLPASTSEKETLLKLDQELKVQFSKFTSLIAERNEKFIQTLSRLSGRTIIVIGAIHLPDLENKLKLSSTPYLIFEPRGFIGDEQNLIHQVEESINHEY